MHTDLFKYTQMFMAQEPPTSTTHVKAEGKLFTLFALSPYSSNTYACPIFAGKMNSQAIHSSVVY